jgi:predicted transcriptional regulator
VSNTLLEPKHKRRDQINIIANILDIAKEGTLKTQIMYRANLSFTQLNDYIVFLLKNGLITQAIVDDKEGYIITVKGAGFLQRHRELLRMIESNSSIRKKTTSP